MTTIGDPDWSYFRESNADPETIFEQVIAKRLFCASLDISPDELSCPDGFAGIECYPVSTSKGWAGYQAKYSHDGKQNVASFDCLKHAFKRKAAGEYALDIVYCYSAGAPPQKETIAQKAIEALAAMHNVTLVWRFADQTLEELRDTQHPTLLRARREFFENLPQPSLFRPGPESHVDGASEYHFGQQATPFIGRVSDRAELQSFLEKDVQVAWWGVVGKGGSGKSRLLLEVGSQLNAEWQWGWLTDAMIETFDFLHWRPNKHTLLIADYAVGREQPLANLLAALRELTLHGELHHHIRLVLIERDAGQWFKALNSIELVGPWVASVLHKSDLLSIETMSSDDLLNLATAVTASAPQDSIDAEALVQKAEALGPERAPLLMQILASLPTLDSIDRIDLIREFIDRDRKRRWLPATVVDEDLDMLVVTTICGGVDLNTAAFTAQKSQDFFAAYSNFDRHAIMIGEPLTAGQLKALEPDLLGELFVLDHLASFNPLSATPSLLLEIAASVNNGRSAVSFFSKCRDDYPNHSAFQLLRAPWASDPRSLFIWSLIVSNVIDVDAIDRKDKLAIYRLIAGNGRPMDRLSTLIEQVLFVRLLSALDPASRSRPYIGHLEIAEEVIIPNEPTEMSFLDQLYAEAYCDDIIEDFRRLDASERYTLVGQHLVTVFHHKLLHRLSDRTSDLVDCFSIYHELSEALDNSSPHNYMSSIIAFHHLAANLLTGIIQFNRHRPDTELCVQTAEAVLSDALRLSSIEIDGQPMVVRTTMLERVDRAFSILLSHTRAKDYQYMLDMVLALERRSPGPGSSANSASNFVETCVQLAHGFDSEQQYNEFLGIYQRCINYADRFPSDEMASALGMIHTQLFRNTLPYVSHNDRHEYLESAISLAVNFPGEQAGVLKSVLETLSMNYRNAMVKGQTELALPLRDKAVELVASVTPPQYSERGRVWCCDLVTQGVFAHIKNGEPIEPTLLALETLINAQFIALVDCLKQNNLTGEVFNSGQRAFNGNDQGSLKRCIGCLELLSPYLPDTAIEQYLDILNGQFRRISAEAKDIG